MVAPRINQRSRSSPRTQSLASIASLISTSVAATSLACDWDWNRERSGPPRIEQPNAPVQTQAPLTGMQAEGASAQRPSMDENMGRSFQGTIEQRLRTERGERRLRYLSRGNTARLQVDGLHGRGAFDALIWGESISVLDHTRDTYRTVALDDVKPQKAHREVRISKTGERLTLQGVICERYEIQDGPLHVSTCVSAVPGTFDVHKLEAVSGLDVPAWADQLLDQQLLPLQASARDAAGRELYSLELMRYSTDSVDDSMVALPKSYHAAPGKAEP
jgi:hypothetical protein